MYECTQLTLSSSFLNFLILFYSAAENNVALFNLIEVCLQLHILNYWAKRVFVLLTLTQCYFYKVWEEKLPTSKSALESAWLYHEIGRCYLETGRFENAREYGEKSLESAGEANDDVWRLNASVLVAQSKGRYGGFRSSVSGNCSANAVEDTGIIPP